MADGYARVTGRVAVIGAQNGPAATLLVPPFAEAMKASVPIVGLVQDVPRATRDRNAFQEFDHFALFAGCTKWIRQLTDPARVDDYVDMAFTAAASGRPGPVVLLLPKDILVEEAPAPALGRRTASLGEFPLDRPRAGADEVTQAARMLADAERPFVIAGGGVHLSRAYEPLARLQSAAKLPVATTTMGKGSVDESHPLSAGQFGSFMGRTSPTRGMRDYVADADVVLLVGSRTNENGTDGWRALPTDATYIHVDVDPIEVNRNYDAIRLVGDARAVLTDLAAEMETLDLAKRHGGGTTAVRRRGVRGPHFGRHPDPARAHHGRARCAPHPGHRGRCGRQLLDHLDGGAPAGTGRRSTVPVAARAGRTRLGSANGVGRQACPPAGSGGLHRR
jgi:acetolactate synthase-1/2/3 large subunit